MSREYDIGAYSAYAIAVKHGYKGTEAEWIAAQEKARKDAEAAAVAAGQSAAAAAGSATKAGTSETNAKASETAAGQSAAAAAGSATKAGTSETNAKASETAAGQSAAAAAGSATKAGTSETNAKASETAAAQSAAAAAGSATKAGTSETNAKASETAAGQSAAAAAGSATKAGTSETNAKASETAAAQSATAAAASELAAQQAAAEAAIGNASPQFIDATFAAILDDTNTTRVFKAWWPLSAAEGATKEQRLARWFSLMKNDKTYGAEFESPDVSSNSFGVLTDDREGVTCELSTDATQGADQLDEHRAFWWLRVNAEEIDDQGTLNVLAHEYEEEFDPTGETAPVMTLQIAPWIKKEKTAEKLTRQLRTKPADGYHLWAEAKNPDGTPRPYVAHYTYGGGYDAAGRITSGVGKRPIIRASYTTGLTNIKKGRQYQTGWNDHDQNWLLLMWQLRHGSLEPSGQMEGCLSYNFQHMAAAGEENVKRVLLTPAQAANFYVGCSVSVGETAGNTSTDRNAAVNYNIADCVRVASKETVNVGDTELVALNLDVPAAFTTTTTTRVSTMPWYSGTTDDVLGRGDGSPRNNTNGHNACRCAGIEFGVGCYRIMYGTLYQYATAEDGTTSELKLYACVQQGLEATSPNGNYVDTGLRLLATSAGWKYIKEMDDTYDNAFFPKEAGTSGTGSSTFLRSAFYHPAYKAGVSVPWSFASLSGGAVGGVACVTGSVGAGTALWLGALGLSRRCWRGEFSAA